ncbi:MAG: Gx transporter family protein [Acutalibacteraceae bacterium]|nr:Gx transporter family protein [Acutalibacteraceae bacterium]
MAKKVALYGILTSLALIFGYIEGLFSLSFIAPGIKLGLANSVALLLLCFKDFKGAMLVNVTRILLSALLFSSPFSLLFSLTAGIVSVVIMRLLSGMKSVSVVGFSIAGAVVHNSVQLTVAALIFGRAVWYYLPFLLVSALISGGLIGTLSLIIFKKIKTNVKL